MRSGCRAKAQGHRCRRRCRCHCNSCRCHCRNCHCCCCCYCCTPHEQREGGVRIDSEHRKGSDHWPSSACTGSGCHCSRCCRCTHGTWRPRCRQPRQSPGHAAPPHRGRNRTGPRRGSACCRWFASGRTAWTCTGGSPDQVAWWSQHWELHRPRCHCRCRRRRHCRYCRWRWRWRWHCCSGRSGTAHAPPSDMHPATDTECARHSKAAPHGTWWLQSPPGPQRHCHRPRQGRGAGVASSPLHGQHSDSRSTHVPCRRPPRCRWAGCSTEQSPCPAPAPPRTTACPPRSRS